MGITRISSGLPGTLFRQPRHMSFWREPCIPRHLTDIPILSPETFCPSDAVLYGDTGVEKNGPKWESCPLKWRAMLFTATPAGPGCRLWESSRFRDSIVTGEALPAEERADRLHKYDAGSIGNGSALNSSSDRVVPETPVTAEATWCGSLDGIGEREAEGQAGHDSAGVGIPCPCGIQNIFLRDRLKMAAEFFGTAIGAFGVPA